MEYLPTLGLFQITLGVNVGEYSIHGSLGLSNQRVTFGFSHFAGIDSPLNGT